MLSMYKNGNNNKNQLKKEPQFKIAAQVTKQDNVRNCGAFPPQHRPSIPVMCYHSENIFLCVCICVRQCTLVYLHLSEEDVEYPLLLLSAYVFEALSLPGPRASVFSARQECVKPQRSLCLCYLWK